MNCKFENIDLTNVYIGDRITFIKEDEGNIPDKK